MMSYWIPGFSDWNVGFMPDDMPYYARYDFVEVWEYVPPEEWDMYDIANEWHPFKLKWKDDFDSFDESRWSKSDDWTFGGNRATYHASQVYVENGELVFKMEPLD